MHHEVGHQLTSIALWWHGRCRERQLQGQLVVSGPHLLLLPLG